MNIVLTFSQYAAVLTKFNCIIGRNLGGEVGVFGEPSPPPPPVDRTLRDVTGIGNAEFSHYTPRCAPEVESRSNLALINLNKDFATSTSWRATVGRQMAVQAGKRSDSGKPVY